MASNQDPHFSGSATFFESTLITSSDENNKRASARPIRRVAVLGAGTMGHGIAQVAAAAGYAVIMRDVNPEAVARGGQSIERSLGKAIQLGKISEQDRDEVLQRIHGTTRLEEISAADLVIEATPENLELKQNLLREGGRHNRTRSCHANEEGTDHRARCSRIRAQPARRDAWT